jgi:hypothetical protein
MCGSNKVLMCMTIGEGNAAGAQDAVARELMSVVSQKGNLEACFTFSHKL